MLNFWLYLYQVCTPFTPANPWYAECVQVMNGLGIQCNGSGCTGSW